LRIKQESSSEWIRDGDDGDDGGDGDDDDDDGKDLADGYLFGTDSYSCEEMCMISTRRSG